VAVIYYVKLQGYIPQTVASVLNVIQIQIMGFIYPTVAYAINDHENHRLESEYRDAMVVKLFLFQVLGRLDTTPIPPATKRLPTRTSVPVDEYQHLLFLLRLPIIFVPCVSVRQLLRLLLLPRLCRALDE